MNILAVNAGSSSLKYQLIDTRSEEVLLKGLCERIGEPDAVHSCDNGGREHSRALSLPDHQAAFAQVFDALLDPRYGALKSLDALDGIGHRVVHGGETFCASTLIDDEVTAQIDTCSTFAPLHNPAALAGIQACQQIAPGTPQVAVFDTAFHQSMPPEAYIYPLPYKYYDTYRIRRYGFHGTSHRYVAERAAALLGRPLADTKLITCHLGNGCSLAAIDGGKVIDTSMGFTPLAGVMMGTRCGNIDPALVTFLITQLGLSPEEVDHTMNKESGLLGISGVGSDLRDVEQAADEGDERARLACALYAYEIRKFLGAFAFALGGLDAIVFTAGVGENASRMRAEILEGLDGLGIYLASERNEVRKGERLISAASSRVKLLVIPTNEELLIARDTAACIAAM